MAKQFINIGIEGNDGTGDSIRDAFNKSNENFTELYAVFGQGGQIGFTSLSDTPDQLGANKIPVTNSAGTAIEMKGISGTGISVDFTDPNNLLLTVSSIDLSTDTDPDMGGPLNASGYAIGNVGVSQTAVDDFNSTHGTAITLDDLVIDKGYADRRYLRSSGVGGVSGEVRVRPEPANATEYVKTITAYTSGNLTIPTHGFSATSNGLPFVYNSTATDANNVTSGVSYYIRFIDDNTISLHASAAEATNDNDASRIKITVSGGTGTQTITDGAYNSSLSGNYLSTEAIQRTSAVRRQGDQMSGTLYLNDHPGDLVGGGTPNGIDDLQAATKYYVDTTSYASTTNLFVSQDGDDTMQGVPADKYGRSLAYAYKTISKAAQRAEQIIDTAPFEAGPYAQTITYNSGAGNSTVVTEGVTTPSGQTQLEFLMAANKDFITNETVAFVNATYPNFTYNVATCKRDIGLIQDAVVLDVLSGLTANTQSIQAGKRYYNSNSGLKAINQQLTETKGAIEFARDLVFNNILTNTAPGTTYQGKFAVRSDGFSSNTFTIFTGANSYVHTYVSGGTVTFGGNTVNITSATYDNNAGIVTVTTGTGHGANVGDIVQVANITWSCSLGNKVYPEVLTQTIDITKVVPQSGKDSAKAKFNIIVGIIQDYNYIVSSVDGSTYTITISNGNTGFVDQNQTNNKDLVPGKIIVGKTSGAKGEIVSVTAGGSDDTVTMFLREPKTFTIGEELEFGNKVKNKQITIRVESGIYEEHMPIKIPANTSIKGDEFRRTIIRPLDAVSQSPWANVYFFRNTTFDSLTIGTQEYGYHYANDVTKPINTSVPVSDPAYNTAINNREMDVFLMNDASVVRNITFQAHGGFAEVLDPNGQVLTKSPYTQTASSFSQSVNAKSFRGGMFIDGYAGNVEMAVTGVNTAFSIEVTSAAGTGLFLRKPQMPAPFYINGARYQVAAITNYDQSLGTATLLLSASSNSGNGWDGTYATPYNIIVQTAGNRSLLANDFVQINDLGYGVVATNGGLSEQVSTFAYYNHISMYANDGGQIRALNCSSANGDYGLVAQGSNPNEKIDNITLSDNMTQTAMVFNDGTVDFAQPPASTAIYLYDFDYLPYSNSEVEIDHGGSTGIVRYEVTNIETTVAPSQPATRDGTVYKVNLGTGGSDNTATTGLKQALVADQVVTMRSSRSFKFEDLEDVSPTRPSTAIVFDEYTDAVYRSVSFQTNDSVGNALANDEAIIGMDSPFDTVKMNVNMTEVVNNTYAGTGTTMGNTVGDVVIAIDVLTQQSDINRLNAGDMIFGWDGKVHRITGYTDRTTYATISIVDVNDINATPIGTGLHSSLYRLNESINLRANLAGGETGTLTVSISTCRATGHDFLDIGTGSFNTTNYPNVIYGDPQAPVQAQEVDERGKGRVFYVSTDQDGFFRVGKFFTVDQGTGSVTFSASIALSNLDGIGFKRGVVVAEFSSDTAMTDNASDTVPTESAVRGYVNRRLHYDHQGQLVSNPIGAGAVARDGSTPFTDNISAGGFKIQNLQDPGVDQDAATKSYVDQVNYDTDELVDNRDVNIIAPTSAGQLLVYNGARRIFTTPANGGLFAGGMTITGSNSGATGVIYDLIQENVPGYGLATRISYNLTSGTDFNTNDLIDNGAGVTANVVNAGIYEIGNGVEDAGSDITVTATRTNSETTINFQLNADSIINADVSPTAAISQSKLSMQAATTRANDTGITQADLGLASFDSGDFTVTNGWVTLKSASVDLADLPELANSFAFGRSTAGTGAPEAVAFSTIVGVGGGLEDGDFVAEVGVAADPGEALIKTGASTYAYTNVSQTGEGNSIVKTDTNGQLDVSSLALDGTLVFDTSASTLQVSTPGGVLAYGVIGSNTNNTQHTFTGNRFSFGGADASTSPSNDNGSAQNTDPALASTYIYTKYIESEGKGANFTGIALGNDNPYIVGLDESTEGQIALVADGVVPVIATAQGLIPGNDNIDIGSSSGKRFKNVYAEIFDGTATSAQYADLAENYLADNQYEVGTVLIFGGDAEVTTTSLRDDTRVAGVVSENPAHLMNTSLEGENVTAVALTGRTPVKVVGVVQKGDMLVSSSTQGFATRSTDPKVGTVIGKALENKTDAGEGVIEAVVGRV